MPISTEAAPGGGLVYVLSNYHWGELQFKTGRFFYRIRDLLEIGW